MKKLIIRMVLFFYIACIAIGCQKKETISGNELYIVDSLGVLIISMDSDDKDYIDAAKNIEGNAEKLQSAINVLEKMDSSSNVENALGVAYLRLRDLDKAERFLTCALDWNDTGENKDCILNNIGILKYRIESIQEGIPYFEMALKETNQNDLKKIAIQSNYLSAKIETEDTYIEKISELKQVVKKEKNMRNENQVIAMCAYRTLAVACCYAGKYEESEKYLIKAEEINGKLYQNTFFEATIYEQRANMYLNQNQLREALGAVNQAIELYESCQSKEYLDTIVAYQLRGSIHLHMSDYEQAVSDYNIAEERECSDKNVNGISYMNSGIAYQMDGKNEESINSYAKAYSIWEDSDQEGLKSNIRSAMKELYYDSKETKYDFDTWFDEKVRKASEGLDENGLPK